ncbi:hypothetical protein [Acidovorax sp. Root217]|uniref:hypothetical protein n=1 Tax=Acidovorax sp. Root217 TaxID=1736492 RepID=UPI000AFE65C1|nr:hypothetical protein [Acidovorax sp. Root217]
MAARIREQTLARHLGVPPMARNRIVTRVRRAQGVVGLSYTGPMGRPIRAARHGA